MNRADGQTQSTHKGFIVCTLLQITIELLQRKSVELNGKNKTSSFPKHHCEDVWGTLTSSHFNFNFNC